MISGLKRIFEPEPEAAGPSTAAAPKISSTGRIVTLAERRRFASLRNAAKALEGLGELPQPGEVLHVLIRAGTYDLFAILPAILERIGRPAHTVALSSLGINARHATDLDRMLTEGTIGRALLCLSDYFRASEKGIFNQARDIFAKHQASMIGIHRTHAKVIVIRFAGGPDFVIESSANLRSCRNLEQATLFDCAELADFHQAWILDVLTGGTE